MVAGWLDMIPEAVSASGLAPLRSEVSKALRMSPSVMTPSSLVPSMTLVIPRCPSVITFRTPIRVA